MPNTLFVGIDVSSQSLVVRFMDQDGNGPSKSFTTSNDLEGADKLVNDIVAYALKIDATNIKIGMESTSNYAWHLHLYLASSTELLSFKTMFYVLNPSVVKGFKKTYTHLPKTDDFDAFVIADCIRFGRVKHSKLPDFRYAALQRLTRFRYHLIQNLTKEKNRALNLIYLKFSSYVSDNPFSDTFGKASTSLIETFTPDEITAMPIESIVDFICSKGNNRLKNPVEIAKKLKSLANRAYRLDPNLADSVELTLTMSLENIRFLESQLKKLDKELEKQLKAFSHTLQTVPGIGPVIAAGIIAEIGDIHRFNNEAALAKFAGLVWNKYQSGNFNAEDTSLAKCGNFYLRYYLVEAANLLRMHVDEYKAFYYKKYKEVNKHQHKRALVLTARKTVRLVFTLLSKGQVFRPGGVVVNS
ncbi:IS110 family transposase [Anaerobranca gottschalkii]|uniref:Transposase and inactivated derivatives n=1 Tax=Anaerobranca gottschalkii DSM 13577 TaxID=1120990 RepID=A0A1I0AV07_9FIRM|nr:IS110 family transposase [Anaerobranca gottschalkii]SES98040.1 Transposase and inactivated derivatives [Anaerobranca gottschalkii DSM 13577]